MDVSDQIIVTLSKTNKSLTISEISLQSGLDRHTVAKYLGILEVLGRVRKIEHGNAKKYFLITSVPVSGLIDLSSDLIIIVNKGLQIQYINSAASHKLGLVNQSILGERIDLLKIDLFSSPEIIEGLKHYSSNKVFRTEIEQTDGAVYLVSILEISLDPGNNLIAITAEDISERKRRELEIIESEEKYRALFTASTDPVVLIDQETGSILEGNTAACSVYGYDYHALCLLNITDIDDEPEQARYLCQHPLPFISNRSHRRRDGSRFPVEISTAVLEIKGKTILIAAIKDISERILAEQSIDQIRRNFETFFNTIDEMLVVLDEVGTILEINDAVINKLGYSREELVGTPVIGLHPPDRQGEAIKTVTDILCGKATFCSIPIQTRQGRQISVETSVSSGMWDGKPAFFGVSKDISRQYRSEERLSESYAFRSSLKEQGDNSPVILCTGKDREEVVIEALKTGTDYHLQKCEDMDTRFAELSHEIQSAVSRRQAESDLRRRNAELIAVNEELVAREEELRDYVEELTRKEQEIRESERRYREIFELLDDLYYQTDENGIITILSPSAAPLSGWTPDDLIGTPVSALYVHPEERDVLLSELKTHGFVKDYELCLTKKDGSPIPISLSGSVIRKPDGTFGGLRGSLRDISSRKKSEQALLESQTLLNTTLDSIPDIIGIQRPDHTMVRYNQAGYDFLHRSPEEVNGHRCYELIGRSMPCEDCASEKALVSGKMERSERYLPDYGRYIDSISTPVFNSNGDIILLIEQLRDITEIKQVQQSLSESNKKLRLLSGLTRHDITNQLNALQLLLDLAIDIQDPKKREEYLLASRQITQQIEILIGFTREYETIGATACTWQQVQSLIQSAIAETAHAGVLIDCNISPAIHIFGDPILRKVFSTLIDNAIRHGETVTRISFTEQISGNDLIILCLDDGTGIEAEEKELIFTHGYGKNTGLGLYLVREILSITGMTIQETGEPGKGARFEILVPDRRWKMTQQEQ